MRPVNEPTEVRNAPEDLASRLSLGEREDAVGPIGDSGSAWNSLSGGRVSVRAREMLNYS